jgi:hypothetical protein
MSIDEGILQEVQQSFGRCANHSGFFDRLGTNFKAGPSPLPPFAGRQQKLLKEDLTRLLMCARDPAFATRPGAVALNVPPQLSRIWIEALMTTVREFDDKFTPELERKWRTVLLQGLASTGRIKLPA